MAYFVENKSGRRNPLTVEPSSKLGRGATATVFRVSINGKIFAAKIFHADRPFDSHKIRAMIETPPQNCSIIKDGLEYPQIAWPTAVIWDGTNKEIGFLLPFVDSTESFSLDHYYDLGLFAKLGSKDEAALSYKLEIAKNLSKVITMLHKQGHYFIDFKPQNIRVFRRNHVVTLIDCDGFSIKHGNDRFPAQMLSTDYISPEAQKGLTAPSQLGEAQDRYALAVILFQLLNRGTHPFQGIITDPDINLNTNDEKAAAGLFPHGLSFNQKIKPRTQSIHHLWDKGIRILFDRAFATGSELTLPSAEEWKDHFNNLLESKSLVRCSQVPNVLEHIRFRGKGCPTCYLEALEKRPSRLQQNRGNAARRKPVKRKPLKTPSNKGNNAGWWWATAIVCTIAFFLFMASPSSDLSTTPAGTAVSNNSTNVVNQTYTDGSTYSGEISNGVRHGQGTYTFADGAVFVGEFRDGERNGQGTYTFAGGNVYVGEFRDGRGDGQGTYTYADGAVFVGEYRDGQRNGQGTFTFGPGEFEGDVFIGEYRDDQRNGQGTLTFASGAVYAGEYRDGQRNGQGTFTSADGRVRSGIWHNSVLITENNIETRNFSSGNVYVGEVRDDLANGQGTYTFADGDVYVGEFREGQFNGQGTFTYASGAVYVGAFRDGDFNGQGTITFASGDVYVGEFRDGKFNGQGTYTFGPGEFEGDVYVGEFRDHLFSGQGTYTFSDGSIQLLSN